MAGRSSALVRFARRERFDLAVAHGSTDQPVAARLAGTPQVTMFDYEYATAMHHWNGRLAHRACWCRPRSRRRRSRATACARRSWSATPA